MSATQQVTGIASGFDTASIVESLMKIERVPYEKLDVKKKTENLRLQAYQAVNSMLLKFRTSVNTLSSQKLWRSKAAVSTNDKSLVGTANEYAVNGSYSFKVAQLATATQYMSKGFANSKTAFVKQNDKDEPYKMGQISLNSAKTRVDTSAKLDILNGGKGIYRGSVRVTDGFNRSATIDLSACDTLDDVVRTLNSADNVTINASIKDGALHIEDTSGGTNAMRIQNVGTGTTANDLGIAGMAATPGGAIAGRAIYTMGDDMSLKTLNDGLGVEEGIFHLRVSNASGYIDLAVNVNDCANVGDVIDRVNMEIQARIDTNWVDGSGGGKATELLDGLRFGVSENKNSFALTGVKQNHTYQFYNDTNDTQSNATPATSLGLDSGPVTVTDPTQAEAVFGRVLGEANSPMLKNLSGVNGTGIGAAGTSSQMSLPFNENTKLVNLNNGQGLDISRPMSILLKEGGENGSDAVGLQKQFDDIFDIATLAEMTKPGSDKTVKDLLIYMNKALSDYASDPDNDAAGLSGMLFQLDQQNSRLVISGAQGGYEVQITGTMASQLGLMRYEGFGTQMDDLTDTEKAARDAFYGVNGTAYTPLTAANGTIYTSANNVTGSGTSAVTHDLTKMTELTGFFSGQIAAEYGDGTDATGMTNWNALSDADKQAKMQTYLDDMLAKGMTFQFTNGVNIEDVTVDLSGINADLTTLTVEDFMGQVNSAIQDAFDKATGYIDAGGAVDPTKTRLSAPQLRLHTYSDSLQWSNMDWSRNWSMVDGNADDANIGGGGGILSAMGLERGTNSTNLADLAGIAKQPANTSNQQILVAGDGYFAQVEGTTQLKDLNAGQGLLISNDPAHTLDIDLGGGNSITIAGDEFHQALLDKSIAVGAATIGDLTMTDYLDALNTLAQSKLDALAVNQDGDADNDVGFKFALAADGGGGINMEDLRNVSQITTSGVLANPVISGVGAVDITPGATVSSVQVGGVIPKWEEADYSDNIGSLKFTWGGEDIVLDTDGISKDSTLADLVDKLNEKIADYATGDPARYGDLRNISFEINAAGTGIAVSNNSAKRVEFQDTKNSDKLAQDLGLVDNDGKGVRVESYTHHNSTSLGKKYIGRATDLKDFLGNAEPGVVKLTNTAGASTTLDLGTCKTVGDVIDFINSVGAGFGVAARINARGDGFDFVEDWSRATTLPTKSDGNIAIEDLDGGDTSKLLKIGGVGETGDDGVSRLSTSHNVVIDVMSTDTLESLMYRISEKGGYKTAIINDGTSTNPYRLTVSSSTTGEASDFVMESDLDMFGFNETSRARDAKVLYGDPNSGSSPILLSSTTNSNSTAISGLTLDLKSVSADWTTITVDTDKEKVVEEIKNMVQTYNDLNDLVSYLDAYDEETGEPGVLFGDTAVRTLMEDINDMFYLIFNPNQQTVGSVDKDGVQNTWSWMDLGVNLTAKNTASDGSGAWYSSMDLDLDVLDEIVAKNWEKLYQVLAYERNASNSGLDANVRASAIFNGTAAQGFNADNAINGDSNKASWGVNNGFMADGTIADGQNTYEIYFQKETSISRLSIFHYDAATALKKFDVEYLDPATGKWELLRAVDNSSDANYLGFTDRPVTASGIRIKASSTNAEDGKFRLLDVQVFENVGLAGQLNDLTTKLGDTQDGFLATQNDSITAMLKDLDDQMLRLQERLDLKEENLWKRFTAMESAMSQLQGQSDYFNSMMSSISNSGKKK